MVMVRNPWGHTDYSGAWNARDPRWTDELAAQVPHGVDPRVSDITDGIFVVPMSTFRTSMGCFSAINIVHLRDDEGYTDDWFDALDIGEVDKSYDFSVPRWANVGYGDRLYITVETYYAETVPSGCLDGELE